MFLLEVVEEISLKNSDQYLSRRTTPMKSTKDSSKACSQLTSPKLRVPIIKVMHENVKAEAREVVPNILGVSNGFNG